MPNDMSFDYSAPAELFLAKRTKSSLENYRRFATAAEAIRYAVETLRTPKAFGASLQVGDERFNSTEIQGLYEAAAFHCASLSDRAPARRASNRAGPLSSANLKILTPAPAFKKPLKPRPFRMTSARVV